MNIKYGNLLDMADQFDVIVHGCNCFHTMGGGIALQIKEKYPAAYEADLKTPCGDIGKLGTVSGAKIGDLIVINAYTQFKYGEGKQVSYDAVSNAFELIAIRCKGKKIAFPMIGAGLAGGNFNIISTIIEEELFGLNSTLVIYT